jgi:hypothetical protein
MSTSQRTKIERKSFKKDCELRKNKNKERKSSIPHFTFHKLDKVSIRQGLDVRVTINALDGWVRLVNVKTAKKHSKAKTYSGLCGADDFHSDERTDFTDAFDARIKKVGGELIRREWTRKPEWRSLYHTVRNGRRFCKDSTQPKSWTDTFSNKEGNTVGGLKRHWPGKIYILFPWPG